MMDPNLNEHEQVEQIKQWWHRYGPSIIIGILAGLAMMYGWQYWNNRQTHYASNASVAYQKMLVSLSDNDSKKTQELAEKVINDYGKSAYAWLANLFLAQLAVKENNYNAAAKHLQWVAEHTSDPGFKAIATIRGARVLLAQGQYQGALDLLQKDVDPAFSTLAEEIKGDILLAMQDPQNAKLAYKNALQAGQLGPGEQSFLLMKMYDIDTQPEKNS